MARKRSEVDLDKLPPSMKRKTRVGAFRSTQAVKETRKPKTKKERAGEIEIMTDLLSNATQEELRAINRILAKSKEPARKKFEKKVQEKMGSFNKGGALKKAPANAKGLKKLPTAVRNKMGYMAKGGKVTKLCSGCTSPKTCAKLGCKKKRSK